MANTCYDGNYVSCGYSVNGARLFKCSTSEFDDICEANFIEANGKNYYYVVRTISVCFSITALVIIWKSFWVCRSAHATIKTMLQDHGLSQQKILSMNAFKLIKSTLEQRKGHRVYTTALVSLLSITIATILRSISFGIDPYGLENRIQNHFYLWVLFKLPMGLFFGVNFLEISIWHNILGGSPTSLIQKYRYISPLFMIFPNFIIFCFLGWFNSVENMISAALLMILCIVGGVCGCRLSNKILDSVQLSTSQRAKIAPDSVPIAVSNRQLMETEKLNKVRRVVLGEVMFVLSLGIAYVLMVVGYTLLFSLLLVEEAAYYSLVITAFAHVIEIIFSLKLCFILTGLCQSIEKRENRDKSTRKRGRRGKPLRAKNLLNHANSSLCNTTDVPVTTK